MVCSLFDVIFLTFVSQVIFMPLDAALVMSFLFPT